MGMIDWFLNRRRRFLATTEPERAFAPEPSSNTFAVAADGDNQGAFALLHKDGATLVSVASGEIRTLPSFAGGILLFATAWEPYSAKTIGSFRARVDSGQVNPFGIVFFENTREEIVERKSDSWYFAHIYVLAPPSAPLKQLIKQVPFQVTLNVRGAIEQIAEGKA
jgi:hypothetical protein